MYLVFAQSVSGSFHQKPLISTRDNLSRLDFLLPKEAALIFKDEVKGPKGRR